MFHPEVITHMFYLSFKINMFRTLITSRSDTNIEVHNENGVPYSHRDKSDVKRLQNSIARKHLVLKKNKVPLDDKLPKSSKKRKLSLPISRTHILKPKVNQEREIKKGKIHVFYKTMKKKYYLKKKS
ncbi:hypothetical protein RclHR1_02320017 [Rhizophagus clarus]|uniref:Uncharacterized protein n=1 Tax=Rhizophagus clarus TaxID=94130 RepID=A0A2Z6R0C4_9GLOM|nr:hypothetical protein RclHR1_02320017 [Rhizophagus clarus]